MIFTTAYREYVIESYELDVVDYLLKPIAFNRFLMSVNKAMSEELNDKDVADTSVVSAREILHTFSLRRTEKWSRSI